MYWIKGGRIRKSERVARVRVGDDIETCVDAVYYSSHVDLFRVLGI
jgi:hypothetical protein